MGWRNKESGMKKDRKGKRGSEEKGESERYEENYISILEKSLETVEFFVCIFPFSPQMLNKKI